MSVIAKEKVFMRRTQFLLESLRVVLFVSRMGVVGVRSSIASCPDMVIGFSTDTFIEFSVDLNL
jgi:hypothetical protein